MFIHSKGKDLHLLTLDSQSIPLPPPLSWKRNFLNVCLFLPSFLPPSYLISFLHLFHLLYLSFLQFFLFFFLSFFFLSFLFLSFIFISLTVLIVMLIIKSNFCVTTFFVLGTLIYQMMLKWCACVYNVHPCLCVCVCV